MRIAFILVSSGLTIAAAIPYILEIIKGSTKPRIVSWFTWTAILLIGTYASFSQHQIPAAVYTFICALGCLAVVILGFKFGDKQFEKLDIVSFIGVLAGLVVLIVYKNPTLAIFASISTDLVGTIPTLKHAWLHPEEETWSAYLLYAIGSGLTLWVANFHILSAVAYPIYLFIVDITLTCFTLRSVRIPDEIAAYEPDNG